MGTYNLATIMGGGEVVFELNTLIDHAGWKKAWEQYCRLHTAPRDVIERDKTTGTEGTDGQYARPGRLSGYLYTLNKEPGLREEGVERCTHSADGRPRRSKGPDVVTPIDEVTGLSTNSVAQGCLEAIEVLEMCGDQMG